MQEAVADRRWPGLLVRGVTAASERYPLVLAVLLGIILGGIHLVTGLLHAPAGDGASRYFALAGSEAEWIQDIARNGYHSTVPPAPSESMEISNVAFFPGYPMLVSGVMHGFDMEARKAFFWATQFGVTLFWTYLSAFLLRWRMAASTALVLVAAILLHPASATAVAGGDPLFLGLLLGLLYWSTREGGGAACMAMVHGMGLTLVKLLGVPALLAGLAGAKAGKRRGWRESIQNLERQLIVALVGVLGAVFFFGFCQARFGVWDLYLQTALPEWRNPAIYETVWQWQRYVPRDWAALRGATLSQWALYSLPWMAGVTVLLELWLGIRAFRLKRACLASLRTRLPLYLAALAVLAFGVAWTQGGEAFVRFHWLGFALWAAACCKTFDGVVATKWKQSPVILGVVGASVTLLVLAGAIWR